MSDLDTLYQEYNDWCIDRGVFAKARSELHHYDEAKWLTYAIELIKALQSRVERQEAVQEPSADEPSDEPFRTRGNI